MNGRAGTRGPVLGIRLCLAEGLARNRDGHRTATPSVVYSPPHIHGFRRFPVISGGFRLPAVRGNRRWAEGTKGTNGQTGMDGTADRCPLPAPRSRPSEASIPREPASLCVPLSRPRRFARSGPLWFHLPPAISRHFPRFPVISGGFRLFPVGRPLSFSPPRSFLSLLPLSRPRRFARSSSLCLIFLSSSSRFGDGLRWCRGGIECMVLCRSADQRCVSYNFR